MSRNEKSLFTKIVEIVVVLVVVAALAGIGVAIYKLVGNVQEETKKSGEVSFTVEYQDKTITSSTNNVVFTSSETFIVTQHGGESEISVAIYAKPAEYTATYTVKNGDTVKETDMSWKNMGDIDFTHCFSSGANEELVKNLGDNKYEINVIGTMKSVLDEYLSDFQMLTAMSAIPETDMFYMQIKSGEEALNIGFRVYAPVESITLPQLSFC
ncbi:MAG: hypothetical protein IJA89_08910 [Clostridia bacterium]|nr:hypothetical protein [Clostridia bacterium]